MNGNDLLPSWSQSDAKSAVLEFVESVTGPGASYVPPAERIATFDNDSTLCCEKPQYVQAEFTFRRWKQMAGADPAMAKEQPCKALAGNDQPGAHEPARPRSGPGQGHHRGVRGNHGRGVQARRAGVFRHGGPPNARSAGLAHLFRRTWGVAGDRIRRCA
jgi:hypothetical protein